MEISTVCSQAGHSPAILLLLLCTVLAGCATRQSMVMEELSRRSRIPSSELKQLLGSCDRTQMNMNICEFRDFVDADLELQAMLDARRESLSQQCQAEMDRANDTWKAERDGECEEETKAEEGGSIRPMLISACKTRITRERISKVKEMNPCPGSSSEKTRHSTNSDR